VKSKQRHLARLAAAKTKELKMFKDIEKAADMIFKATRLVEPKRKR
jgi:hypothetical protein